MKDGIAMVLPEPTIRGGKPAFSCYAKVGDARALASVIGEDELSPIDKLYLKFGKEFETTFHRPGSPREPQYP